MGMKDRLYGLAAAVVFGLLSYAFYKTGGDSKDLNFQGAMAILFLILSCLSVKFAVDSPSTTRSRAPGCHRCRGELNSLDMSRGAANVGAPLPTLFNGVVCERCRKIECMKCKGTAPSAPCTWCGGQVSPAFSHLVR